MSRPASPLPARPLPTSVLAAALLAGLATAGSIDPSSYKFHRGLRLPDAASGSPVMARLEPQILSRCRQDLADVRVLDDHMKEVPRRIVVESGERKEESRRAAVIAMARPAPNVLVIDLSVADAADLHDEMEIEMASPPFFCEARLDASADRKNWTIPMPGSRPLESLTTPGPARIDYPETASPFLRLKLDCHEPEEPSQIRVKLLRVRPPRELVYEARVTRDSSEKPRLSDLVTARLVAGVLPVSRIVLHAESPEPFRRNGEIRVRKSESVEWGVIARPIFESEPKGGGVAEASVPDTWASEVQAALWRDDGPRLPIGGMEVRGWERKLLFRPEPDRTYALFYGDPDATPPRYPMPPDIERASLDLLPAAVGPEQDNASFVPPEARPALIDAPRWILGVVLAFVALAVGFFLFRLLRS